MMLFWFLVCLQVGMFALAFLGDFIWKKRMAHPAERLEPVCQSCARRNSPIEVSGFWVHQYRDCWISCIAKSRQKAVISEEIVTDAQLAEASVAPSQTA